MVFPQALRTIDNSKLISINSIIRYSRMAYVQNKTTKREAEGGGGQTVVNLSPTQAHVETDRDARKRYDQSMLTIEYSLCVFSLFICLFYCWLVESGWMSSAMSLLKAGLLIRFVSFKEKKNQNDLNSLHYNRTSGV